MVSVRWKPWMVRTMDKRRNVIFLIHIPRAKRTHRSMTDTNSWLSQGTEVLLDMCSTSFSQRQKPMLQLDQARATWAKVIPADLQGSCHVTKCPPRTQSLGATAELSRSEVPSHRKLPSVYQCEPLLWVYKLFLEILYGVKIQNIHRFHSISWKCYTFGCPYGWDG